MSKPDFACTVAHFTFYGKTLKEVFESMSQWDGLVDIEQFRDEVHNSALSLGYYAKTHEFMLTIGSPVCHEVLPS